MIVIDNAWTARVGSTWESTHERAVGGVDSATPPLRRPILRYLDTLQLTLGYPRHGFTAEYMDKWFLLCMIEFAESL
jgi:hypothetical protein